MRDARTRLTSAQTRAGHRHSRAAVAEGSKVISNKFLKYVTICSDTAHWSPMLNESNPPMKGREEGTHCRSTTSVLYSALQVLCQTELEDDQSELR